MCCCWLKLWLNRCNAPVQNVQALFHAGLWGTFFRLWNIVWFVQSLVFFFRHEKLQTVWREYEEANRLWLNIRLLDLLSHWTQHRRSTLNRLYELFTVSRYSERRRWRSCQGQRRAAFRSSWQSTDAHAEDLRLAATQHNTSAWERYTHTHTHTHTGPSTQWLSSSQWKKQLEALQRQTHSPAHVQVAQTQSKQKNVKTETVLTRYDRRIISDHHAGKFFLHRRGQ